jgi:hypothetical protein
MTGERTVLDGARELSRLLGALGAEQPQSRRVGDESARAERLAARLDRELSTLVRRRRVLRIGVPLAAAAVLLVAVGVQHWGRAQEVPVAIEQEPLGALEKAEPALPSAPSAPVQSSARAPVPQPHEVTPLRSAAPAELASAAPLPSAEAPSTLGEENRLFESAAKATRAGNVDAALADLDQLLNQHPQSPLAQGALVRKFRLLASAGRAEAAASAARRYLQLYPTGFAIAEAGTLMRGAAAAAPAVPEQP